MNSKTTILLAAHGARTGSASNEMIESLARRLRDRRPDLTFRPAFNLGEPRFSDAIPPTGDVIVVPVMTGRGYFVDERLPEELARSPHYDAGRVTITPPVGCVPAIVDDVVERGVDAWRDGAVVLVVAHGTTRDATSRAGGEGIAARIVGRLPTGADVRACFLDDAPLLEDVAPTLPADAAIVVVPWLLGGGGHFNDDIRERLGDAFARATVCRPLGELPSLDDAVLSLVDAERPRSMSVPLMRL